MAHKWILVIHLQLPHSLRPRLLLGFLILWDKQQLYIRMVVRSLIYNSFQTVGGKEWLLATPLLLTFNTIVAMCNFPVSLGYPNSWRAAGHQPSNNKFGYPLDYTVRKIITVTGAHLSLIFSEMFAGYFLLA